MNAVCRTYKVGKLLAAAVFCAAIEAEGAGIDRRAFDSGQAPVQAPASSASCYKLERVVEWKDSSDPKAEYKPWSAFRQDVFKTSYMKLDLKKNIADAYIYEIWTFWIRQNLARAYSIKRFWISGGKLYYRLMYEQLEKINGTWISGSLKPLWVQPKIESFEVGETKVYFSEINDRSVRVTMTFSAEKDMEACTPPKPKIPQLPKKRREY